MTWATWVSSGEDSGDRRKAWPSQHTYLTPLGTPGFLLWWHQLVRSCAGRGLGRGWMGHCGSVCGKQCRSSEVLGGVAAPGAAPTDSH